MEKYQRITDKEVFNTLESLKNDDEQAMKKAIETVILLNLDVRHFLRKIHKELPKKAKVYKQPTGNKKDIVVGEK